MALAPSLWLYDDLEGCCDRYYIGWNKPHCMNAVGTGKWFVDWAHSKCVADCEVSIYYYYRFLSVITCMDDIRTYSCRHSTSPLYNSKRKGMVVQVVEALRLWLNSLMIQGVAALERFLGYLRITVW